MAEAPPDSFDRRMAVFDALVWRNRIVDLLRIAVPAAGILAFVLLVGQIMVANFVRQYGVSGIRVDRGKLVVDTPQYSGVAANGARYVVNAREARTALDNTGQIDMVDASMVFIRPGRADFHATAPAATMDTGRQFVTVPAITAINSDDGMHGTLTEVRTDLGAGTTWAEGPVDITFPDGSNLTAAGMRYDGALWSFQQATLVVPDLPQAAFPPIPFVTSLWVVR